MQEASPVQAGSRRATPQGGVIREAYPIAITSPQHFTMFVFRGEGTLFSESF